MGLRMPVGIYDCQVTEVNDTELIRGLAVCVRLFA